jgi:hypothetical protein
LRELFKTIENHAVGQEKSVRFFIPASPISTAGSLTAHAQSLAGCRSLNQDLSISIFDPHPAFAMQR